jgi:hypothetical protein
MDKQEKATFEAGSKFANLIISGLLVALAIGSFVI